MFPMFGAVIVRARRRPRYLLHKPSGQARVIIHGKHHYLGQYDSKESHERYEALISEWLLADGDLSKFDLTVSELCLLFVEHAEQYYRRKDGSPTGTVGNVREALRYVVKSHGSVRVKDFGPRKLKKTREAMIGDGRVRTNINRLIHWVRRAFRWGVENEYVPISVYNALQTVSALQPGRSDAKESHPVKPVDLSIVSATLPHLTSVVRAMVRLQLLTGARPGEITMLRPCDLTNRSSDVWVYRPPTHKTEHRGKRRVIHIGPEAQKVLLPFLDRPESTHCFTPAESLEESLFRRSRDRKQTPRMRRLSDCYNKDSYNTAIRRACEFAFGMPDDLRRISRSAADEDRVRLRTKAKEWRTLHCWSAGQLRHTRATDIREKFGIEAAQLVLGHADLKITEVYAERNDERVAEIMRQIG